MLFYEKDKACYIPMDFNMFYSMVKKSGYKMQYTKEYTLTELFFTSLNGFIQNSNYDYYILDMRNIVSAPSRIFETFNSYSEKILLANVNNYRVNLMIEEGVENIVWDGTNAYASGFMGNDQLIKSSLPQYRKDLMMRIVKDLISESDTPILLSSSGLYSNCFVDIKGLFRNVEEFQYIIFSLCEKMKEAIEKNNINAFVSSSKNGAIIANILAGLMGIKEVHLIGIGPKYAMEIGDSLEYIRQGKRYAYIYDFMCTGTEAKIVSALINSRKAYLPYAIGVARYSAHKKQVPIHYIEQLVDTEEMDITYKIVGEKRDI